MLWNEDEKPAGRDPYRRGRFELFYFEQVGSRSYLRFTNLALVLVLFLTLGAMAMIIAFYVWNRGHEPVETDINIHVPARESTNYNSPLIRPAPIPSPPRTVQGPAPVAGTPTPLTTPTPVRNSNRMPSSSPSPRPTSAPSPIMTPT